METSNILIQLDSDPQPSVFDAVVAIDSEVDRLLQYGGVEPTNVVPLVHGAMFTRGVNDLHQTAIFVGGSNASVGETIVDKIKQAFFGPIRVSVMLDSNGSNTTAAAAVLCASRHLQPQKMQAVVLGGTGPVGGRVARLLARQGALVHVASRDKARASVACKQIVNKLGEENLGELIAVDSAEANKKIRDLDDTGAIFSCGAAGVELVSKSEMEAAQSAAVAIDLNAVPPAGLAGVEPTDKAVPRGKRVDYGAIGVGGLKMKIHRAAIRQLFKQNDQLLDAEQIFDLGASLEG